METKCKVCGDAHITGACTESKEKQPIQMTGEEARKLAHTVFLSAEEAYQLKKDKSMPFKTFAKDRLPKSSETEIEEFKKIMTEKDIQFDQGDIRVTVDGDDYMFSTDKDDFGTRVL